ncbi:unnamed protein product [Calicophoron daubneyi]|uniref:Secreted protein n=1 Tax=Calicophoron daubneyi TaxID=300641 RepID=A0AAV2U0D9_CALDB
MVKLLLFSIHFMAIYFMRGYIFQGSPLSFAGSLSRLKISNLPQMFLRIVLHASRCLSPLLFSLERTADESNGRSSPSYFLRCDAILRIRGSFCPTSLFLRSLVPPTNSGSRLVLFLSTHVCDLKQFQASVIERGLVLVTTLFEHLNRRNFSLSRLVTFGF